jgi:RNA polymerase sigma-70 factor (ECF subfamily)
MWGIAIRQLVSPVVRSAEDELLVAVEHGDVGTALRSLSPELRRLLQATVIDG